MTGLGLYSKGTLHSVTMTLIDVRSEESLWIQLSADYNSKSVKIEMVVVVEM